MGENNKSSMSKSEILKKLEDAIDCVVNIDPMGGSASNAVIESNMDRKWLAVGLLNDVIVQLKEDRV